MKSIRVLTIHNHSRNTHLPRADCGAEKLDSRKTQSHPSGSSRHGGSRNQSPLTPGSAPLLVSYHWLCPATCNSCLGCFDQINAHQIGTGNALQAIPDMSRLPGAQLFGSSFQRVQPRLACGWQRDGRNVSHHLNGACLNPRNSP
jgi:hypothetical protein